MEPQRKFEKQERNTPQILKTALLLAAIFVVLILVFIAATSLLPSFMGRCVAVVHIDTELTTQGEAPSLFSAGEPSSTDLATAINGLNQRDDVGAVVFVFDSPGGDVVATHEVYNAVKGLNKPTVSYIREMAASGAYYVASGTNYIISDPDAITGSIGVVTTFTDMSGLLEKVGVNVTSVASGDEKEIGSMYRPLSDEDYNITYAIVSQVFEEFEHIVVQNRGTRLNSALFAQVLDGRILSGTQAVQVGLVDQTGTEQDAIKKAADMAGISYTDPSQISVCDIPVTASDDDASGGILGSLSLFRLPGMDAQQTQLDYK
jgi:protease-4